MFPRILDQVIEWVKAHKQFGLEFEDRGSRTWVFVRTWRRDSFYRVAVGWSIAIMAMLAANWSLLGKFCVQLAMGRLWFQCPGGRTPLLRATRSIWEADACAECWIIRLLTSGCWSAAYKKLPPLCSGRSIPFRWPNSSGRDWKVLSIAIGCSRDNPCEGRLRQVTSLCLG